MESKNALQPAWTATSLAQAAGIDRSYVSRLCRQGKIVAQKFGQAWMIPYEEGQRWLNERAAESESSEEDKQEPLTAA